MAAVMVELAMVLVVTQLSKNATPLATSSLGATSLYITKQKVDAGSIQQHAPSLLPLDAKLTDQLPTSWKWLKTTPQPSELKLRPSNTCNEPETWANQAHQIELWKRCEPTWTFDSQTLSI
jgi:hypothetical protein